MPPRATLPAYGLALGLLSGIGGCMIPDYHMPGGFSSSYYRALRAQRGQVIMANQPSAPVPAVTEPVPPDSSRWNWVPGFRNRQPDPPPPPAPGL